MCVFCKIVNKEFSSKIVYEDDEILSILDLSQISYGHTLVMPKKHYDNILSIPDDLLARMMIVVKKLTHEYQDKLGALGFNIVNNCNEVAGQTVMHFHIHIVPRYKDDNIKLLFTDNLNQSELNHEDKYNLDEIIAKLK